jgi:hypothetical protein
MCCGGIKKNEALTQPSKEGHLGPTWKIWLEWGLEPWESFQHVVLQTDLEIPNAFEILRASWLCYPCVSHMLDCWNMDVKCSPFPIDLRFDVKVSSWEQLVEIAVCQCTWINTG